MCQSISAIILLLDPLWTYVSTHIQSENQWIHRQTHCALNIVAGRDKNAISPWFIIRWPVDWLTSNNSAGVLFPVRFPPDRRVSRKRPTLSGNSIIFTVNGARPKGPWKAGILCRPPFVATPHNYAVVVYGRPPPTRRRRGLHDIRSDHWGGTNSIKRSHFALCVR